MFVMNFSMSQTLNFGLVMLSVYKLLLDHTISHNDYEADKVKNCLNVLK